jgi:hypothetical protein
MSNFMPLARSARVGSPLAGAAGEGAGLPGTTLAAQALTTSPSNSVTMSDVRVVESPWMRTGF